MDTEALIAQYKNQPENPLCILLDGGIVLGRTIDSENHTWYIIRRDTEYTVELAYTVVVNEWCKPVKLQFITTSSSS